MGGKSVTARSDAYKMRHRLARQKMKSLMEERASAEKQPPFVGTVTCKHCGFKAHYPFHRCPECGETHKEPEKKEEQK